MSCSINCILSEIFDTPEIDTNPAINPLISHAVATSKTSTLFQTNRTKLHVLVFTMTINDNITILGNLKQWFKGTIFSNKYKSEIKIQSKSNNLDYLIDPALRNNTRLFALSFKNGDNDPKTDSFDKYHMPSVEIKYFNTLIDNKSFFDQLVKNKK